MAMATGFGFDNSYARLPGRFFARLHPTPVPAPRLIRLNAPLARRLGLDPDRLRAPDGVAVLAGNRMPEDAQPLAMAYAGHQFGSWVPQLGDGRAILLGEVIDCDGVRRDIQLKGCGQTPFSRSGDGRAVLGPVLREYLVSEAMAALGIPTTRALAALATGQRVLRERPLPGAILTRVSRGHVRVGTFEFFAARRDTDALRRLADHVIARHDPEAAAAPRPALALLDAVIARQAALVARWMLVGFIHGVMNTDNMSVAGETIDYGPCAFMDEYHPATVFSSIDHGGRYAWGNQPAIAHWNLACLAQALLPLLDEEPERALAAARASLDAFPDLYRAAWAAGMRAKLGLCEAMEGDEALWEDLLRRMAENRADFTLTFRRLSALPAGDTTADGPVRRLFADPAGFDAWAAVWRRRLAPEARPDSARQQAMRAVNPAFIPRNHLVEAAIAAATDHDDLTGFERLAGVLARPFDDQPDAGELARPPRPEQIVRATYCGT